MLVASSLLVGCSGDFVFEISVGPLEPDMRVVADDEEHQPTLVEGRQIVLIQRGFSDYGEAMGSAPTEIMLLQGARPIFQRAFAPSACALFGSEWERESIFVMVAMDAETWSVRVSKYECVEGDRRIVSPID